MEPNSPVARFELERGIAMKNHHAFGEGLHVLQDSFSHDGLPGWHYHEKAEGIYAGYGHPESRGGPKSKKADLPNEYAEDAVSAAEATFEAMLKWRVAKERISDHEVTRLRSVFVAERPRILEWARLPSEGARERWLAARGITLDH